jgi:hypothetical protein
MSHYFSNDTLKWSWLGLTILLESGMSQLVSEHYRYNTSCTVLFSKTYGDDTLRCPYKDYSSLNRWQANRDLLSTFTLCNLLSVMTHLWQGKKVSILPPSDVNPGPVPSRWDLLEYSPYHVVGVACRATSHDRAPRAWRPRNVL